jgi:hypothetical protein
MGRKFDRQTHAHRLPARGRLSQPRPLSRPRYCCWLPSCTIDRHPLAPPPRSPSMPRLMLPSQTSFARFLTPAAGPRLAVTWAVASTSRAAAYSTAPPATRRPFSLESVSTSSSSAGQPLISAAALDAAVKPRRAVPRPKKAALTLVRPSSSVRSLAWPRLGRVGPTDGLLRPQLPN